MNKCKYVYINREREREMSTPAEPSGLTNWTMCGDAGSSSACIIQNLCFSLVKCLV